MQFIFPEIKTGAVEEHGEKMNGLLNTEAVNELRCRCFFRSIQKAKTYRVVRFSGTKKLRRTEAVK